MALRILFTFIFLISGLLYPLSGLAEGITAEEAARLENPIMQDIPETPEVVENLVMSGHGFAMHGELKYGPDFTHFDYTNPNAPKGGTIRLHSIGTYDSLNPYVVKGVPAPGLTFLGQNLLYDSLTTQSHDEPFSQYGLIAETIEMPEDRSWVAFNLRSEAKWHDGKPITADDVVWTFHTLLEKGTPFFKAYYGDVEEVMAESPQRIIFKLAKVGGEVNAELPLIVGQLPVLPKHYWTADGITFGETTLKPPLGSGAYKIADVQAGRSITYERVKDWWAKDLPISAGQYNFDKIVYDFYRDNNVALEAFFAGEYDYRTENTAKLWHTSYDEAKSVKSGDIIKEEIPNSRPAGMQGFVFNTRNPIFQDVNVRKALAYAFDFEWSNKQVAYGSYTRTDSYFENSELAAVDGPPTGRVLEILEQFRGQIPASVFDKRYEPPTSEGNGNNRRNLRIGSQLLAKAGYPLGEDGIRFDPKTNKKLEFEILESNPQFERWTLPFIENLEKMGVKATFRVVDSAQYTNRIRDFDFDMTIGSFAQSSSPGNEQRDFWGSEKADAKGSRNIIGIKDPAVDKIIEMIINAPSREELVYRCRALDRILMENYYVIPQWHISSWRVAYWKKLKRPENVSPFALGVLDTWWANDVKSQ